MKTLLKGNGCFADIIDAMNDLVRVLSENGDVLLLNSEFEKKYGDMSGMKCYECWGRDSECEECTRRRSILSGKTEQTEREINGRYYSVKATPVLLDDNATGYVEVLRDVSDIVRARDRLMEANKKLTDDLEMAKQLQMSMLPSQMPELDGLRLTSTISQCDAVGGDGYGCCPIDDEKTLLYISDVSGHGVSAAMITVFIQQYIDQLAKNGLDCLQDYIREIETGFCDMNVDKHVYVTMFLCIADTATGTVEYANLGHSVPPLLYKNGVGCTEIISCGAPISYWGCGTKRDTGSFKMDKGDRLLLYTDGIEEPGDEGGSIERVKRLFGADYTDASGFIEAVTGNKKGFMTDDMAIVIAERY